MAIVTQYDPGGLAAALPNIGNILGQALQQRGQREQQQAGAQAFAGQFDPNSPFGKIVNNPEVVQYIASNPGMASLLGSVLGEQTKQEGISGFFNQYKQPPSEGPSPIEIAKMKPNVEIEEGEYIQTPQGTFGAEDIVDLPTFGKIPRQMIGAALRNPNEQVRRWGEGAQKELNAIEKNKSLSERERDKRTFEINKPIYEKVNKIRESRYGSESALTRLQDALSSDKIRTFLDWAAGELGLDPLKTTEAQILESASKELFIKDLEGITGVRFQQFLEKILREAGATLGKSAAANQEFIEAAYMAQDVKNKYEEIFNELEDKFNKQGLELPRNAGKLIQDKMRPYEAKKIEEYKKIKDEISKGKISSNSGLLLRQAQRLVRDQPAPPGTKWIMAPNGEVKPIPFELLNEAKKAGGKEINE